VGALVFWIGLPARSDVRGLRTVNPKETSVMRQRAAEARAAGRKPARSQAWVPLSRISRNLVEAVVSSEDGKFFGHQGVDWEALKESAQKDWEKRRFVRGGSTITQQLAKNLYFTTRRDPVRKLRELVVARWLEEDLSKRRILEIYLNVIEWGDGIYGIEAASRTYFDAPASTLDAAEAALLAGAIVNPRLLNPARPTARLLRRQQIILKRMGAVTPPTEAATLRTDARHEQN
jgi:monofunctional biosynthetic peptidoglycan transglycosylase